ncbi:MAG: flavodoxin-dependent (E)-4-hydroxy-3-methylbut-2-enyl-diphosphate synthase [Candidatus Omnitrophota bacterium]|jgi:(E)-4-hydroxy-3-methylbut-2-enyl-diphosphate synthase|nr:MAG: flavodoxin-dependent (E)-4-hydroxy-3-methylbut-2-enyl-diphosphate synthase [Candidatus Omnitrophota bacterium]
MDEIKRSKTRLVKVGNVKIGAGNAISIQSMAKTSTKDIESTCRQIGQLQESGCQIVRLAVLDMEDARSLKKIKAGSVLPIVADIHFDWRLAIAAIDSGVDKIRLNPGNIYKKNEVANIVSALKSAHIPLRVGANSGSLRGQGISTPAKLVSSVLAYLRMLEGLKFYNTVVSLKASNVLDTIEAYTRFSRLSDYPLHLGVTATGFSLDGAVKSSVALGHLLLNGIGDTIRVSLTDDPRQEVRVAKSILESLGLRKFGIQFVSCPTCGRCQVDLINVISGFEKDIDKASKGKTGMKVAFMGCVVNGPGEAKEADIGLAFGKNEGLLFYKGKPVKKVSIKDSKKELIRQIKKLKER